MGEFQYPEATLLSTGAMSSTGMSIGSNSGAGAGRDSPLSSACSAQAREMSSPERFSAAIPTRMPRSTYPLGSGPVVNGCASLVSAGPATMYVMSEIRPTLDKTGCDSTAVRLTPCPVLPVTNALS